MSKTISSTYASGFTLTTATSPLVVTSTGVINKTSGSGGAIYGAGGEAWTITNSGHVTGGTELTGIFLGGFSNTVTNAVIINNSGGVISGQSYGILVNGQATITNESGGTVSSFNGNETVYMLAAGTLVNYGVITNSSAIGAYLLAGGSVLNGAGATIEGSTFSSSAGIRLEAAGTVTNAGTIIGGSDGAILFAANSTSNRLIVDPGAVFTGGIHGGDGTLELASAASAGTLASISSTDITNFAALQFDAGAHWTVSGDSAASGLGTMAITGFTVGDTIDLTGFAAVSETFASNALTLTNAATQHATLHIHGTFVSSDFQLASYDGGTGTEITEGAAGLGHTLSATYNTFVKLADPANNPLTVTNTGTVTGTTSAYALYAPGGADWTITNAGVINGGTTGNGIQLGSGATYVGASVITNQAGGTITGAYGIRMYNTIASSIVNQIGGTITATDDRGIYFGAAGTLMNAGVISAPTVTNQQDGVLMDSGGTIINDATGTISGGEGVVLLGSGTVTNAGTIEAATGQFAVQLSSAGGSRLIVDPGAVFTGGVYGGNGTLELASAASAGTLAAAGFTNFTAIDFDTGSEWTIVGSTTALSGTITGFASNETIDLTGFVATSATYASGTLTLTNAVSAHETLHFSGGGLQTSNFHLFADGTGGTDISYLAAPSITAPPSYQGLAQAGSSDLFSSVQVTDANPGAMETVTVAMASPADGALSDADGGSFDPLTGEYTVSGTPGQVNTALANLVFVPSAPSSGYLGTTTFEIEVSGTGGSVSASTNVTSVQQVLGLATISAGNLVISVSPDGTGFAPVTGGKSYEAVVLDPSAGGVYLLPAGYQAEFLGGPADATLSDPSGGNAVLVGNSGADTISSGAANDTLLAGDGGTTVLEFTSSATDGLALGGAGGTITASDAGHLDTIAAFGVGLANVTTSGTDALVFGGTGNLVVSVGGSGTTLVGGSGTGTTIATIAGGASDAVVFGGTDDLAVVDQGSHDTIAAFGSTSANVTTSGSDALVFGGTGSLAITDQGSHDTIAASGAASANVTASGTDALVFGGTGILMASLAGSGTTLLGGSGTTSATIAGSVSDAVVFGGADSLAVTDQGNHDTIAAFGATSANITTSGTDALVFGGTGSLIASVGGSGTTLLGGSGSTTATIAGSASGAVAFGGAGSFSIDDQGSLSTIAAFGASSAVVTVAGSNDLVFGGSGLVSVTAGSNGTGDTIVAGGGALAVTSGGSSGLVVIASSSVLNFVGGGGGAMIVGGSGTASVTGGAGGVTLFGAAGGDVTYGGSVGGLAYLAGSGNETLDASGSTTNDLMFGGSDPSGQDTILAGSGSDTMVAGIGNDMLAGSSGGGDLFIFASVTGAAPHDVVANFMASDAILLVGYAAGVTAAALASATSGPSSTTLTLSDSTTITFAGVTNVSALEGHIFGG